MKPVHTVEDIVALKREAVRRRIDAAAREPGQTAERGRGAALRGALPGPGAAAGGLDALVTELAKAEPNPDAAARNLAAQRMETTRARLQAGEGHRQRGAPARHRGRGAGREPPATAGSSSRSSP